MVAGGCPHHSGIYQSSEFRFISYIVELVAYSSKVVYIVDVGKNDSFAKSSNFALEEGISEKKEAAQGICVQVETAFAVCLCPDNQERKRVGESRSSGTQSKR